LIGLLRKSVFQAIGVGSGGQGGSVSSPWMFIHGTVDIVDRSLIVLFSFFFLLFIGFVAPLPLLEEASATFRSFLLFVGLFFVDPLEIFLSTPLFQASAQDTINGLFEP